MVSITLDEIKQDVEGFLNHIEAGETLVVTKRGKPVAEVKPLTAGEKKPRPFGLAKGDFIVPDNFDAPLPDSVLAEFGGE